MIDFYRLKQSSFSLDLFNKTENKWLQVSFIPHLNGIDIFLKDVTIAKQKAVEKELKEIEGIEDLEDFKELVSATHYLGLKIIIDWVANHTGYDHHWTIEKPDYYLSNKLISAWYGVSGRTSQGLMLP